MLLELLRRVNNTHVVRREQNHNELCSDTIIKDLLNNTVWKREILAFNSTNKASTL